MSKAHHAYRQVALIGAGGAIGQAFIEKLLAQADLEKLYAFSRAPNAIDDPRVQTLPIQYNQETDIAAAAAQLGDGIELDLILVTVGLLHQGDLAPEKSLSQLSSANFERLFKANTITPALIAKHFLPLLAPKKHGVFAALSARVGSITDNHLGGWYAYRASKAALNMVLKTTAIETQRRHPQHLVVGLHPGTVNSPLSKPFQSRVPDNQLFSPDFAATQLLTVLAELSLDDTGKCFAWDGSVIDP